MNSMSMATARRSRTRRNKWRGSAAKFPISVFAHRGEDWTPDGLAAELREWQDVGASRYFLTLGWDDDLPAMVTLIAEARQEAWGSGAS